MAKSKRRKKLAKAKMARKRSEQVGYIRSDSDPVNERTKYGKRWLKRRRGVPMASRPIPPWWSRLTASAARDTSYKRYDKEV